MIPSELLDILICPIKGEKLIFDAERALLVNLKDNIAYPIENGIPILLKERVVYLNEKT